MYTVRGFVREKDGSIHTDSETKIITVLLYMNEDWREDAAGCGCCARRPISKITPPKCRRTAARCSFSGAPTAPGTATSRSPARRRAIQLNWVTSQAVVDHEQGRHRISTKLKKFRNLFMPSSAA